MGNENTKLCETCRHPYESEDHLCRKAMPASDGGPAFPVSADVAGMERLKGSAMGMSLRDYFAAKAMAALIAEPVSEGWPSSAWHWTRQLEMHTQMSGPDIVAHAAYMMADAMLRARESAPAADLVREAAPDLLAALKSMNEAFRVDQTRFTAEQADAVRKMDAAIARATGGEA